MDHPDHGAIEDSGDYSRESISNCRAPVNYLLLVGFEQKSLVWHTLGNFFLVGLLLDCFLGILPEIAGRIHLQILYIIFAIPAIGFGSAIYISGDLGEGPIELAMVGISDKLRIKPGLVRMILDVFVAILGYILGGPVGVGSVVGIVGVGPSVQLALNIIHKRQKNKGGAANGK